MYTIIANANESTFTIMIREPPNNSELISTFFVGAVIGLGICYCLNKLPSKNEPLSTSDKIINYGSYAYAGGILGFISIVTYKLFIAAPTITSIPF